LPKGTKSLSPTKLILLFGVGQLKKEKKILVFAEFLYIFVKYQNNCFMKKKLSLVFAICSLMLGSVLNLQAQLPAKRTVKTNNDTKSAGDSPQKVAEDICNCVNNFFNQYHPTIKKMIEDMVELGEEKATEKFQNIVLSLQGKEQEKAIADAQKFSSEVNAGKMDNCLKMFQTRTTSMSDAQKEQILRELEISPACKMVDDLIRLGSK